MNTNDLMLVFQWWFLLFIIGLLFIPITFRLFSTFIDKGYLFAKILGITIVSYTIFVLGILHVLPFTQIAAVLVCVIVAAISFLPNVHRINNSWKINKNPLHIIKGGWKIIIFEEILFLLALFFWATIRGYQPDINGLEKYMDFGFVNSLLRTDFFPPKDMWFTPFPINYYYFGHLITAVLTKLSGIHPMITFNLMLATIFAFTFSFGFSIGINLLQHTFLLHQLTEIKKNRIQSWLIKTVVFFGGMLSALLLTFGGNLHTIYAFFKPYANDNPLPFWQLPYAANTFPNTYWYPNATRFIHNTIHEFPIYSFVVSDLHGHVIDIPLVLFTLALLFSITLTLLPASAKKNLITIKPHVFTFLPNRAWNAFHSLPLGFGHSILFSFIFAVMYMTNVWDSIIYFSLTALVLFFLPIRDITLREKQSMWVFLSKNVFSKQHALSIFYFMLVILIGLFIFLSPFNHFFKSFVSSFGVLCAPKFLIDIGHIGPLLFEADHCQKSPLWQLFILYGFFYFWIISFFVLLLKTKNMKKTDPYILMLILLATILIIIPEFIYGKDIYPAHYRANTMFKLVYQAFILLSFVSGYIIIRLVFYFKSALYSLQRKVFTLFFLMPAFFICFLVFRYPFFAVNGYYGDLTSYKKLDGLQYLKNMYPDDYEAILWLNTHVKGQPIILEAQGDSYTNYARVSANTGLPTVLGWTVHEWLWRGTYDIPAPRITEIQTLYTSSDIQQTKALIQKYHIVYVFIGNLEREKYPTLLENKFDNLGTVVFRSGKTHIYKISLHE